MLLGKNLILVHAGTNDLTNGTNTVTQVYKIVKTILEMEGSWLVDIGFPDVIEMVDRDFKDQVRETNDKLKKVLWG